MWQLVNRQNLVLSNLGNSAGENDQVYGKYADIHFFIYIRVITGVLGCLSYNIYWLIIVSVSYSANYVSALSELDIPTLE